MSDWVSVELSETLVLRYSKKADSLPITTFGLSLGEPCMDSGAQVNQYPYILEVNRFTECPLEPANNRKFDPRF